MTNQSPGRAAEVQAYPEEIQEVAKAMRDLVQAGYNEAYVMNQAAKYLKSGIDLGAFSGAGWARFRLEAQHWFDHSLPLVEASDWFIQHGDDRGLNVDKSKGNGDVEYWVPFIADLIDRQAVEIVKEQQEAETRASQQPRNWWEYLNHRWKHSLIGTGIVIVAIAIPAIRGVIAFVHDILNVLGSK